MPPLAMTSEEMETERQQVELAQTSMEHFGPLYQKYFSAIYKYCYLRTSDRSQAEEICSQVFLNAMSKIGTYRYQGVPFSAWLYRIASNLIKNTYRDDRPLVAMDSIPELSGGGVDEMLEHLEETARQDLARRILTMLPDQCLELITLRFYDKLPFALLAKQVNKSEAACKMALKRCLERIRTKLEAA